MLRNLADLLAYVSFQSPVYAAILWSVGADGQQMLAAVTSNALVSMAMGVVYGYFGILPAAVPVAGYVKPEPGKGLPVERTICGSGCRGGTDCGGYASNLVWVYAVRPKLANTAPTRVGYVTMALSHREHRALEEIQQFMVAEGGNRQIGRQTATLLSVTSITPCNSENEVVNSACGIGAFQPFGKQRAGGFTFIAVGVQIIDGGSSCHA